MRKHFHILSATILLCLSACNNNDKKTIQQAVEEPKSYFPVTSYIKGQLFDIKQKGVTPFKYTTVRGRTDSVMIKLEELDSYVKEFLQPEIDSVNLIQLYTESKFLDQTIDAYTFTYEPINPAKDTLGLQHWDVYIDPETGKVKRVYIVKNTADGKTLQLTWLNDQWFKKVTIANSTSENLIVEKEEKISWSY